MSYEVRYTGTRAERMARALKDAKEWCGKEHYEKVMRMLCTHIIHHGRRATVKFYPLMLSFSGMHGAPARAMMLEALKQTK